MLILQYIWASPNTLLGLLFALITKITGGQISLHTGVIEAHSGITSLILKHLPFMPNGAAAITIGHVVIARTQADLNRTRAHERIHVQQYQRWGPLFLPAYFTASLIAAARGQNPYRNNAFEEEAYRKSP